MHGGAAGSGAPRGNKNALKHGRYARAAIPERQQLPAATVAVTDSTDRVISL
jgi:glucans biosynthesis protein